MAKRDPRDERRGRDKFSRLLTIVLLLFVVLVIRLFGLQYFQYDYYSQYAEENQLQRERIIAPRGLIKDRNGVVLVDNVPQFDVVVKWRTAEAAREAITDLHAHLQLDTTEIFSRFEAWQKRNKGIPFPVVPNADKVVISYVRENNDLFPAMRVETTARRRYRRGEFAAHLLGYVGEVNDEFLAQRSNKNYFVGDVVGKSGIESACEPYLRGGDGQKVVLVNATGNVLGDVNELLGAPEPGRNVVLTIDLRLQQKLEDLIEPIGAGAGVVMDVETGAILAVASLPQFDPNLFAVGITQTEWDRLHNAKDKPLFNRFLQATYPPGSTMKIASAHAILRDRIVDPNEAIAYCTGAYRFGNRIFRCWKHVGHGWVNWHSGFVNSCDVYYYETARVLDVDALASACRDFGLGSRTGIDLPNEASGLVPDRDYYNRRYGKGKWTQGLVLNNIIGQGEYLATVLQMVRVSAAVANGGQLVQPHVIQEIENETQGVFTRRRIRRLSDSHVAALRRAMEGVVHEENGTGRGSRIEGIRGAGKTGTSQNPHGDDHAWFIGYVPADKPEIAIAVVLENAGHGGAVAAPLTRQFYLEYFSDPMAMTELILSPEEREKVGGAQ